jgi:hypothetical protein
MRLGLLGVDLRVPDATSLAVDRVLTPSGASIVKERKKKSEQEVPGVRATSEDFQDRRPLLVAPERR